MVVSVAYCLCFSQSIITLSIAYLMFAIIYCYRLNYISCFIELNQV